MKKEIADKFASYPPSIRKKLARVRNLILEVASSGEFENPEETLKWGEPSYWVKGGSTVRFDWKSKNPDHYAIYFNCKTKLIDTFKEMYGDLFNFEGNRAIVFHKNDPVHSKALKHCIELSLRYHSIKRLPLLGG